MSVEEIIAKSKFSLNLYENSVALIGPVPPQYECIYFVGMFAELFMIVCVILSPIIVLKGVRRR